MNLPRLFTTIVLIFVIAVSAGFCNACAAAEPMTFNKLKALAEPFPDPQPGSWQ